MIPLVLYQILNRWITGWINQLYDTQYIMKLIQLLIGTNNVWSRPVDNFQAKYSEKYQLGVGTGPSWLSSDFMN
jgi:hypothetical protein